MFPVQSGEQEEPAVDENHRIAVNLAAMTRLHELGTWLAQAGDFTALLARVLDAAIALTGAGKGYIQFIEPANGDVRLVVQRDIGPALAERLSFGGLSLLKGVTLQQSRRLMIGDVLREPTLRGTPELELLLADGIRAMATVPLATRDGELLGILGIQFPAPRRLSEDELRFLDLASGMASDFIKRREAEEALRLSEERFRAIVNAGAQVFFRMSPDWMEMSELSGGEFLADDARPNRHWLRDHVHPDDRERVWEKVREIIANGANFELEHRIRRPDGEVRWLQTRVVPLRDADGHLREWFGAATDITARKVIEQKLLSYQNELEEHVMERTAELDAANGALRDEIIERGRAHRVHEDVLRQLSTAQEAERRRISRELHDEVGQQLAALLLGINELADRYGIPPQAEELRQAQTIAQTIAAEIHDLAVELRPTALDDLGLVRALGAYVERWAERAGVPVDFHATGFEERRLSNALETAIYRIVQEALHNVRKHARARAVSVLLELKEHEASAIVEDDGIGFDVGEERAIQRLGILGMTERAALVGGTLRVESSAGAGTTVMMRLPV